MDDTTYVCPRCKGRKGGPAFIDGATGGSFDPFLACDLCKGEGAVSAQTVTWHEAGRAHYQARVARGESLMECATRLGIGVAELSGAEHGRRDPVVLAGAV